MTAIPLFPLGTVLFPGVVLPLHIFEPRYRTLVRMLMQLPDDDAREFGVVGIRQGWEVGEGGVEALYDVGCTAELRQARTFEDGTFDIVTVGRRRFRLLELDSARAPFLCGEVEWLPEVESAPAEAELLASSVGEVFGRYLSLLSDGEPADGEPLRAEEGTSSGRAGGRRPEVDVHLPALPDDPLVLSHLVAASAPLTLDDRQDLLSTRDTVGRLRRELRLLKREATMLRRLRAVPVPLAELRVPQSLN